ncbi:MAG: hypothetical protein JO353_08665 [Phycisphaerae bacterium]|nr:hypothetical protein [Phycisphaerae bacterium]
MPPSSESIPDLPGDRSLQEVVRDLGVYPIEAFQFVQQGLSQTIASLHGDLPSEVTSLSEQEEISRHISGQQLSEGLRQYALDQWGLLARVVLRRWNITSTLDFGRIVFAMVEAGMMKKTDDDTLEDFRDVFDFKAGFESAYQIGNCT